MRFAPRASHVAAAALCACLLTAGAGAAAAAPRGGSDESRVTASKATTSQQRGAEVSTAATGAAPHVKDKATQQAQTPPTTIVGGSIAPAGAYRSSRR